MVVNADRQSLEESDAVANGEIEPISNTFLSMLGAAALDVAQEYSGITTLSLATVLTFERDWRQNCYDSPNVSERRRSPGSDSDLIRQPVCRPNRVSVLFESRGASL